MFNALSVAKVVISGVVGVGTGKIVAKIIKNNVNPETLLDKVTITAAAWVIGAVTTEYTKKYTDDTIDNVVKLATETIDKFKLGAKLNRIEREESTFEDEGLNRDDFTRGADDKWHPIKVEDSEVTPDGWVRESDDVYVLRRNGVVTGKIAKDENGKWANVDVPTAS